MRQGNDLDLPYRARFLQGSGTSGPFWDVSSSRLPASRKRVWSQRAIHLELCVPGEWVLERRIRDLFKARDCGLSFAEVRGVDGWGGGEVMMKVRSICTKGRR